MEETPPGKINYFSLYHPNVLVRKAGIRPRKKRGGEKKNHPEE